jgi:hypothetical protein
MRWRPFREECEVRVVAIPGSQKVLNWVRAEHRDFIPPPLKQVHTRTADGERKIRYIILFEALAARLPIRRVIVGPSRHRDEIYDRARKLLGPDVLMARSATLFIG